jgi:hypothetical protein
VPLCLVILIQQTLWNGFNLGVFGGFHGKMFLRVDFRFLLIEWVLGTELLAKGSPRGTPTIPQSLTWIRGTNWEIDRLTIWVFPAGWVLPDCPGQNWPDRFPKPVWPV